MSKTKSSPPVKPNGSSHKNGSRPIDLVIGKLKALGCDPVGAGASQWKSRCPAHRGKSPTYPSQKRPMGKFCCTVFTPSMARKLARLQRSYRPLVLIGRTLLCPG